MSRSSSIAVDPLSNVLDILGARVARRTRIEAAGEWSLFFPGVDRLKFVALLRGDAWISIPGRAPRRIQTGDVCLIGRTDYVVCSDPTLAPVDGHALYDGAERDIARINGEETVGIGGTVTFAGANADFLLDMLPDFWVVPGDASGSNAIAMTLNLMSHEIEREAIGGEIVRSRLADILLVEAIRACASEVRATGMGWLGALLDPRIGRALGALHEHVAYPWTVAELAGIAGMSRAAFSAEFSRRIGQPPLSYLRSWRLTVARTALMRDNPRVADVAEMVGYHSQSAFSQAFRRAFGTSPKDDTACPATTP